MEDSYPDNKKHGGTKPSSLSPLSLQEEAGVPEASLEQQLEICTAISSRYIIEFSYHGTLRVAEPYCLGIVMVSRADNESLLCYQIGGYSDFGDPEGWKLYRVSEMGDIEITRRQFPGQRLGYDPRNLSMELVYCHVIPEASSSVPMAAKADSAEPKKTEPVEGILSHNEMVRRFRFTHL
jgi:hypothetical protein